MEHKKVRIGIDVGGTFTHAVALAADRYELLSQAKVPTTHTSPEGVATGIIDSLKQIMTEARILPEDITYIAHSTTQATNALLEGDVCVVGICAMGTGLEGLMTRRDTVLEPIELAQGIYLQTIHEYVDIPDKNNLSDEQLLTAIRTLIEHGAQAIVAAAAFSVDDPTLETRVLELAAQLDVPATATHEISQLYGLKARTRTAAVNAAIMPRMIQTAQKTQQAVLKMNIQAPLVVMRSDGGAMAIDEMKRRPVLTLLSGPAAGVAAALMAARIADGIFLEVGGTSTDISCIVNGRPSVKMARIGQHKLYLNTIDVRTLGIAGGSLVRFKKGQIAGVGPRSAHIAGLKYLAFAADDEIPDQTDAGFFCPDGDTADYLCMQSGESRYSPTTTCAANLLGVIPSQDYARGNVDLIARVMNKMAAMAGFSDAKAFAQFMMRKGSEAIIKTVDELIAENKLDTQRLSLIGGGGGAGVWVYYVGQEMGLRASVVEYASVISAIGAAMALLQETVERTIIDPQPQDFVDIRQRAEAALLKTGADPSTLEVRVEVDTQRGILRATATGAHHMALTEDTLPLEELNAKARQLLNSTTEQISLAARTSGFALYQADIVRKKMFGLIKQKLTPWVLYDNRGRVRASSSGGAIMTATADGLLQTVKNMADTHAVYGDAGLILPAIMVITDNKVVDLTGLTSVDQLSAVCMEEQSRLPAQSQVIVAVKK